MKLSHIAVSAALVLAAGGCSKHECELSSDEEKKSYGDLVDMTAGGFSCYVSNGELVASHGDVSVDAVTTKYKTYLEGQQWKVEVADHSGTRSNGNSYQGKIVNATKDGRTATTLIYPLADTITETVTSVK